MAAKLTVYPSLELLNVILQLLEDRTLHQSLIGPFNWYYVLNEDSFTDLPSILFKEFVESS